MTPPIEWRTVVGQYLGPDSTPVTGQLRFIPSDTVYDSAGAVIIPAIPITVTLEPDGSFEIQLGCTDAPGVQPSGWYWRLSALFPPQSEASFALPVASPPVVQLADLVPATSDVPLYGFATLSYATGLDERLTAVEAESAVTFAAVGIHPFLLMGA